jgi:hypothetical protein
MNASNVSNWVQCGRKFSAREIKQIRETVSWLPGLARGELAATVCEHLEWHTAAGTPKIQACQKLLERLEAAKLVGLPTIERQKVPTVKRAGIVLSERTATITPLSCALRDIEPVHLEIVTDAAEVGLWNEYVERFPPLGYKGAFGQLAWRVAADWHGQWGFSPLLMETFVDPRQFAGTCYRAAGWELLGETCGRGLARPGKRYHSSPRLTFAKPLDEDFRRLLCAGPLPGRSVS